LNTTGPQLTQVPILSVGQQCIVAEPASGGQIVFSLFSFLSEKQETDKSGKTFRVLFGKFIKSDTLLKNDAARDALYSAFFDKNGHFKRQSVIQR
jgi:hypothetical protein